MPMTLSDVRGNSFMKEIKPIRLHLELSDEYLDCKQREILKKYGNSSIGCSIGRDILIPSDMPLHALHYAIQKLFGWQNSHLRSFHLPDEVYHAMTNGTVKGWAKMSGILFYGIIQDEEDVFWDDDFQGGNLNAWLRRKYIGPYVYAGNSEHYESAQASNRESILKDERPIEVRAGLEWDTKTNKNMHGEKIVRVAPIIDLTLEELRNSVVFEQDFSDLLERLEVTSVLAAEGDKLASVDQIGTRRVHPQYGPGTVTLEPEVLPITHKIFYHYDYGDGWQLTITLLKNCRDLLDEGHITSEQLSEAEATVTGKHKPVCLYRDGLSVMDDVGGMSGFANFLRTIHEGEDADERASMREWATEMGWSARKVPDKSVL